MQTTRFPFASPTFRFALLLSVAAVCIAPMPGVHAAPPGDRLSEVRSMHRFEGGEPYALVRPGARGDVRVGNRVGDTDMDAIKGSVQGEFFWFRKDGKEYIVQDAATLERIRQAWAPTEKLGAEMERQGEEMGRHGKTMGALGKDMGLASATLDHAKMEAIGKKMEEAGKPMEALGKKMDALGKRMEAEQAVADRTVRGIIKEAIAGGLAKPAPRRG